MPAPTTARRRPRRAPRAAVGALALLLLAACGQPVAQPERVGVEIPVPTVDPATLDPGLGWAKVGDVERPIEAFALPSGPPRAPTRPGTAGHPGHFPGQAVMTDVLATADGLVAVGYVGVPWTAIGWTSIDGGSWQLTQLDGDDPSFATGVAAGTDGRIVAVGRRGPAAAAWISSDGGRTWQRSKDLPTIEAGGEAQRIEVIVATGDGFVAGGSAGPELGARRARLWRSQDGVSWVAIPDHDAFEGAEVRDLIPFGDGLLALGRVGTGQRGTGTTMWHSPDLQAWTRINDPAFDGGLANAVAVTPDAELIAVGSDLDEREALVWHSHDGRRWTRAAGEASRRHEGKIRMTDVVATPAALVAVGNQVSMQYGEGMSWLAADPDGRSWTKAPYQPSLGKGEPLAVIATERLLVAVGSNGAPDTRIPTVWLSPVPGR